MRYTYSFADNRIYCMTFYAGKTVKGVSKRHPDDEFDLEGGKKLARARCDAKVALKRLKRAQLKQSEALSKLNNARKDAEKMNTYCSDAFKLYNEALQQLKEIEEIM